MSHSNWQSASGAGFTSPRGTGVNTSQYRCCKVTNFSSSQGLSFSLPPHCTRSKADGACRAKQHTLMDFSYTLKPISWKKLLGLEANRKALLPALESLHCALVRTLEVTNKKHQCRFLFSSKEENSSVWSKLVVQISRDPQDRGTRAEYYLQGEVGESAWHTHSLTEGLLQLSSLKQLLCVSPSWSGSGCKQAEVLSGSRCWQYTLDLCFMNSQINCFCTSPFVVITIIKHSLYKVFHPTVPTCSINLTKP